MRNALKISVAAATLLSGACSDTPSGGPDSGGPVTLDTGDGEGVGADVRGDGAEDGFFSGYGSCTSDPPLCYLAAEGWAAGPIPTCGASGTYIFDCLGNGANCNPTTDVTAQRSR